MTLPHNKMIPFLYFNLKDFPESMLRTTGIQANPRFCYEKQFKHGKSLESMMAKGKPLSFSFGHDSRFSIVFCK